MSQTQSVDEARAEVDALQATVTELKQTLAESEASRNDAVRVTVLNNQSEDLRAEITRLQNQIKTSTTAPQIVTEPVVTSESLAEVTGTDEPPVVFSNPVLTSDQD